MTEDEMKIYCSSPSTQIDDSIGSVRWQLPLTWIQRMVEEKSMQSQVSPPLYSAYLACLMEYRRKFQELFKYDWVCVPLVYTQVAALATYGYFTFCLLGRQFLNPAHQIELYEVDFYVPIFTILQFLFFVGWFKVGQDLMRPFGEDDDDIELNYILDRLTVIRNVAVSFALVHYNSADSPKATSGLYKDDLYDAVMRGEQIVLPHTRISAKIREHPPKMHAFVDVSNPKDMEIATALTKPHNLGMFVGIGEPAPLNRKKTESESLPPEQSSVKANSHRPSTDSRNVSSRKNSSDTNKALVNSSLLGHTIINNNSHSNHYTAQNTQKVTLTTGEGTPRSTSFRRPPPSSLASPTLQRRMSTKTSSATSSLGSLARDPSTLPIHVTINHSHALHRTESVLAKAPASPGVMVVNANLPRLSQQKSISSADSFSNRPAKR